MLATLTRRLAVVSGPAALVAAIAVLGIHGGCDDAASSTSSAGDPAGRTVKASTITKADAKPAGPQRTPFVQPADRPNGPPIRFDPPTLSYGELPPGQTATGTVRIMNVGDRPITLGDFRVSCHCTEVTLTKGVIPAGGVKEFEIFTEPKSGLGDKLVKVRMAYAGYPENIDYEVRATVTLPIRTQPSYLEASKARADGRGLDPVMTGQVWLEDPDGKPFRVLSAHGLEPDFEYFNPDTDEPRDWYLLNWDLNKFGNRIPGYWCIETDRADCPIIEFRVRHPDTLVRPQPGSFWMTEDSRIAFGELKVGETYEFPTRLMYLSKPSQPAPTTVTPISYTLNTDLFTLEVLDTGAKDGVRRRYKTRLTAKKAGDASLVYETAQLHHGGYRFPVQYIGRIVE